MANDHLRIINYGHKEIVKITLMCKNVVINYRLLKIASHLIIIYYAMNVAIIKELLRIEGHVLSFIKLNKLIKYQNV